MEKEQVSMAYLRRVFNYQIILFLVLGFEAHLQPKLICLTIDL